MLTSLTTRIHLLWSHGSPKKIEDSQDPSTYSLINDFYCCNVITTLFFFLTKILRTLFPIPLATCLTRVFSNAWRRAQSLFLVSLDCGQQVTKIQWAVRTKKAGAKLGALSWDVSGWNMPVLCLVVRTDNGIQYQKVGKIQKLNVQAFGVWNQKRSPVWRWLKH